MNILFEQEFGASQPMLPLKDSGHIVYGNSLRIDWNEVCPNNGSDEIYIVGNPPFGGTANRSDEQTEDMELVFKGFKKFKSLDYVASWFWKGSQYIANSNAELALVSTNSIVQGEQVATLFPYIFKLGICISSAYQSFPWRNNAKHNAAVHVVVINLSCKQNQAKTIYKGNDGNWHSELVDNISPYLIAGSNAVVESRTKPLVKGQRLMFRGNQPTDGGNLLLSEDEKKELIINEPLAEKWIKKVVGSNEFLNGIPRYCLWLTDITDDDLNSMPKVAERVARVREMRLSSKDSGTRKMADTPHKFRESLAPKNFIILPIVSSERRRYVPIGFIDSSSPDVIATNLAQVIPEGSLFDFGILNSTIHNDWMRTVSSRLKSDYRYLNTLVYNTFPFPKVNDKQTQNIEKLAEEVLLARASNAGLTLAKLYDPDKMPDDLKQAHSTLDDAVDKLYRPQGFANTEERLAHLLARYEQLIEAEKQSKGKKKAK